MEDVGTSVAQTGPLPSGSIDPEAFRTTAQAIEHEVEKAIVGQHEAVRGTLICLIVGGHALLEGIPGLGKTSLARAFAGALGLTHNRVQFTPDLMPADITGTTVLVGDPMHALEQAFQPGPVFSQLLLADEINRASPRTQSALLEAMQEGRVTIAGTTHQLPRPFCVLATQNPVEMQGTYPLPEAQIDRFLLKLRFTYPTLDELSAIVSPTRDGDPGALHAVADGGALEAMGELARGVPAASYVDEYIGRLLLALQPGPDAVPLVRDYVRLGPSPRGGQALALAGRVSALLDGRYNLSADDLRAVALPALRHRLVLGLDAQRDDVTPEVIIADALARLDAEG